MGVVARMVSEMDSLKNGCLGLCNIPLETMGSTHKRRIIFLRDRDKQEQQRMCLVREETYVTRSAPPTIAGAWRKENEVSQRWGSKSKCTAQSIFF